MDQGAAQPRKKTANRTDKPKKTAAPKQPKYSAKRLHELIRFGEANLEHRAQAVWFVIEQLVLNGKDDNAIVTTLLDPRNRIGDYYREQTNDAEPPPIRQHVKEIRAAIEAATGNPDDAYRDRMLEHRIALQLSTAYTDTLRHVEDWAKWMHWDGVRWVAEGTLPTFDRARSFCRDAGDARARTIAAVAKITSSDDRQRASIEQWDVGRYLLGTPKGTVDLKTGQLRPQQPSDYITRITTVVPGGECPLWQKFLRKVTAEDQELQGYLQRVAGYCLTGDTKEEALFFIYGPGQNGKGTLVETISGILGDYAKALPMETLVITRGSQHPTDVAMLRGARLAIASENEEGQTWAEAKIKRLTGGGKVPARLMRQDFFEYVPQFKLLIEGNHKPIIRAVDKAIRRRMNLIPFLVKISDEEKDGDLKKKLVAEWPGILQWMIEGCLEWQRIGLKPPTSATAATEQYLEEQDILQLFLNDCCVIGKAEDDTAHHIWRGWVDYMEDSKEHPGSARRFYDRLGDRFEHGRRGKDNITCYFGLRCIRENRKDQLEELRRKGLSGDWGEGPTPIQRAQAEISVKRHAGTTALCAQCSKGHEFAPIMIIGCGDFPEMPLHPDCALPYFVHLIFKTQT